MVEGPQCLLKSRKLHVLVGQRIHRANLAAGRTKAAEQRAGQGLGRGRGRGRGRGSADDAEGGGGGGEQAGDGANAARLQGQVVRRVACVGKECFLVCDSAALRLHFAMAGILVLEQRSPDTAPPGTPAFFP
jgi:hypothetical protein